MGQSDLPVGRGSKHVKALEGFGWSVDRIKGSHHMLVHGDDKSRRATVPVHSGATIKMGTLRSILSQTKLSEEELLTQALGIMHVLERPRVKTFLRAAAEQGIEVEVRAPGQVFLGAMSSDEIEQSVQAKTFLTLYNVFYLEQQSGSLSDNYSASKNQ